MRRTPSNNKDPNTRDAKGLASDVGRSVVVFNTNLNDLMLHINNLTLSLKAKRYSVVGIAVEVDLPVRVGDDDSNDVIGSSTDTAVNQFDVDCGGGSDTSVSEFAVDCVRGSDTSASDLAVDSGRRCDTHVSDIDMDCARGSDTGVSNMGFVCGSFHQGDERFENGGSQCMAVSLVAMAIDNLSSVFSWNSEQLNEVVVLGNALYSSLRDSGCITDQGEREYLCVPDMPAHIEIKQCQFRCEYGNDFVSGEIGVDDGQNIKVGVHMSLQDGLQFIFEKYDKCFLTMCDTTCAIIKDREQFAIVDSHARNSEGIPSSFGVSVVLYFSCLSDLCTHILRLGFCLTTKNRQFELCGVNLLRVSGLPQSVNTLNKFSVDPQQQLTFDFAHGDSNSNTEMSDFNLGGITVISSDEEKEMDSGVICLQL
ncbi:uncharacterized protein LOC143140832 [Alosa pseudoharengus]|uniref:uncharacterized protein LOC143140832 n=1 Tax=Alosa pseudoharengus TaxID=34774 RepID=UPI003F8CB71F